METEVPNNEFDIQNQPTTLDDEDDEDLFGENDEDEQTPSNDINTNTNTTQNINLSNLQNTSSNIIDEDMNMNSNNNNNNIETNNNNEISQINNELFNENNDEFKDVPQYNNKRYIPKGRPDVIKIQYTQPPPKNAKYYILKLPNVIGIESDAFSKDDYFGTDLTQKGIDSTIRWQITTDATSGEQFKSSNTRFVVWSDNSKSLIIGDQVYDIDEQIYYGSDNNNIHKNRDYLYADLMNTSSNEIKICHGKFYSRLNVKPSTTSALGKLRKNINKKQSQKFKNNQAKTISLKDRKRKKMKNNNFDQLRNEKEMYQKNLAKQKPSKMDINNTFLETGANEDDDDEDASEDESDDESSDDNQVITGNNNRGNNNIDDDIEEDSDME